jgi:diaminopimelate epimerase
MVKKSINHRMIPFVKAHACGNDFLILEESLAQSGTRSNHAALARKLCARTTSVGADGIEFLDRRANGELFLRLFNADGSEAELSGNGTRCVAAWLALSEGRAHVTLGTHGGPRASAVLEDNRPTFLIESEMGTPRVMPRSIELPHIGVLQGAMVNVGNPHFVLFVETEDFSVDGRAWQQIGALISTSPLFAHGTNVEFVRVVSRDEIAFRIYERGCGPTTSSGTGTCASSAAAMALRGTARALTAVAEGGMQRTVWPASNAVMCLTGPAEIVCTGEVYPL